MLKTLSLRRTSLGKFIVKGFMFNILYRKKLFKLEGLKEQFAGYIEGLVQDIWDHTLAIYRGSETLNMRDVESGLAHSFKEVIESNERVLEKLESVNKLDIKGEEEALENMSANMLETLKKASEQNQKAKTLCFETERITGEGSPLSLKVGRFRSYRDTSLIENQLRPLDVRK